MAKKSSKAITPVLVGNIEALRYQSRISLEKTIHRVLDMSKGEIKERFNSPNASLLEIAIIKIVLKAIEEGNPKKLNELLCWIHGKPTERLEITSNDDGGAIEVENRIKEKISSMSDAQIIDKMKKLRNLIKQSRLEDLEEDA
jgi:hypothetical protein